MQCSGKPHRVQFNAIGSSAIRGGIVAPRGDVSVLRRFVATQRRSVLRAFLVLGSDRPFVPAISAAPSKGDGLPLDRRLRPHESSDAAFGAPVRKPKAQMHERGGLYLNYSSMRSPSCGVVGNRHAGMKTAR